MYLQYYAIGFFLFYFIDKKNWYTWLLLSILCSLLKCNTVIFDVESIARYEVRVWLMFIAAITLLLSFTLLSCYQAVIILLFLAVNALMLYNKSFDNYFHANFEALIYGLVACQFIPIIPRVWRCISDINSGCISSNKNKFLVGRI